MTIPGAIPAEIADQMHDFKDDPEGAADKALERLVDLVMDGECYPRKGSSLQANLLDILADSDAADVAGAICAHLSGHQDLEYSIRPIVTNALRDTRWHEMMADEIAEEERELAEGV